MRGCRDASSHFREIASTFPESCLEGYNSFNDFLFLSSGGRPAQNFVRKGVVMFDLPLYLWNDDSGQDIAEYAVMLAVILVLVVGTIPLAGSNASNAFASFSSTLQYARQEASFGIPNETCLLSDGHFTC